MPYNAAKPAVLVALLALAGCSDPPPTRGARVVGVSADGNAVGTPDTTSFSITVTRIEDTADAALKSNTDAVGAITAKLVGGGAQVADIRTSSISVAPNRVCTPNVTNGVRLENCETKGAKSTQSVSVIGRDLSKAGSLMAIAVAGGAEQLTGGQPYIGNLDKLREAARDDAVALARKKAQVYAEKLGMKLGPVRYIADDPSLLPGLHREAMPVQEIDAKADSGGAGPIPIEPGQRLVSRRLYVVWELR